MCGHTLPYSLAAYPPHELCVQCRRRRKALGHEGEGMLLHLVYAGFVQRWAAGLSGDSCAQRLRNRSPNLQAVDALLRVWSSHVLVYQISAREHY